MPVKVDDLHLKRPHVDDYVFWLEVSVHVANAVELFQTFCYVNEDLG